MVMYGPLEHNAAVARIAQRVRYFHDRKETFRLYHGHTNSTRKVQRLADNIVDTSLLKHVLRFDLAAKTVEVEPNVCMDQLLDATLQRGLIPLVVPEFCGITVGGAFAGTAGESSSYKHGLFDSTVTSIEIVLADGTIKKASQHEHADLLYGSGGACGTLGVVTLLKLNLMDAKHFVQVQYHPVHSAADGIALIKDLDDDPKVDFIDGILYSPNRGVIMSGKLTNDPTATGTETSRFTRAIDQHYYRHVEKRLSSMQPWTDLIPIRDYIFRYDRGCFWGAERAFKYFHVPFNRVTRWILDPFMSSKVMFHAMHESGLADQAIIQDVAIPIDKTEAFITWQDRCLNCYPLWLCPLRAVGQSSNSTSTSTSTTNPPRGRSFGAGRRAGPHDLFCNIGIWMMAPRSSALQFVQLNRLIERQVFELHGLKTLYAHSYYTADEFWQIYDRDAYVALREKYAAGGLMDVWEKVTVKARKAGEADGESGGSVVARAMRMVKDVLKDRWPFRGLYGVWKVLTSREYLLKEKSG